MKTQWCSGGNELSEVLRSIDMLHTNVWLEKSVLFARYNGAQLRWRVSHESALESQLNCDVVWIRSRLNEPQTVIVPAMIDRQLRLATVISLDSVD